MKLSQHTVRFAVTAFLVSVSSIGGAGNKEWESVRVTDDDSKVAGCTLIGEVKGKSSWGGALAQNVGEEKAYKHLKRNAWEMGGNTVLLLAGRSGWGGSKYRGEAYRCDSGEMKSEDAIVLGGVEICGPEQPSLDYLGAVRKPDENENDSKVHYTFEIPVPLTFGGLDPSLGYLVTNAGHVEQVVVGWQGLTKTQQKSVWAEIHEAFVASKGNPGFEEKASRAKWIEAGGRKETWISRNEQSGSVRIAVICGEELLPEKGKGTVDSAF